LALLPGIVVVASIAAADPFRWQAHDGSRIEAELVALADVPRLRVTQPAELTVELPGAAAGDVLRVQGFHDDLVVVGDRRAWRLRWVRDRFELFATASWTHRARQPEWARPRALTNYRIAFDELRQLVRFEDTLPGIDRYFAGDKVTVKIAGRTRESATIMKGSELLSLWRAEGFPLARGALKGAGPYCTSIPDNWWGSYIDMAVPIKAPERPRLASACFDKELRLSIVNITVPD
jgi:hypothetical protein